MSDTSNQASTAPPSPVALLASMKDQATKAHTASVELLAALRKQRDKLNAEIAKEVATEEELRSVVKSFERRGKKAATSK